MAWTGAGLTALVLLAVFGPLLAVALAAEAPARLGAADMAAIRFTLLQAALSALVSVAAAIPVARAGAAAVSRGGGFSWR
jgi:thiamine transport system permease protein